ncbi:MAG: hypothetical protein ACYSWR_00225 [Planctomycetota bacterium]|jgi:hypothetical protein
MDEKERSDDVCCSSDGKSWKTLVFVVVILLAGGVAAHSLLTRGGETASLNVTGLPETTCSYTKGGAESEQPSKAVKVLCGVTVDSLMSLERLAADKNAVFILLAGGNEEADRSTSAEVEAVVDKLSAKGKNVAAFTLQNNTDGYDQLVKRFSVQSLPCVIVAGRGCGAAAVSGEITKENLLGAFVKASLPASSCGPRVGSPCCPRGPKK